MQRSIYGIAFVASLALVACSKTSTDNASSSGGGSSSGSSSGSGGSGGSGSTAACNAQTQAGLLTVKAPCAATAVGTACANDWECWSGQTCVSQKCAATSTDEKKFGSLTLPDAGDYLVSVFIPADKPADAPVDAAMLAFTFASAARDVQVWKKRNYANTFTFNKDNLAIANARVRTEPAQRFGEAQALGRGFTGSVARANACTATQFGFKGACFNVGDTLSAPIKCTFCGGTAVTAQVVAIEKDTAILLDTTDAAHAGDPDIQTLLDQFSQIAGPRDRTFFNAGKSHATNLDTDGNGMLAVVLSSKVGASGNAGLYDFHDVLATTDSANNGNVMDIVWVQPPNVPFTPSGASANVTATEKLAIATVAHEYQHLINFARRSVLPNKTPETLFLNESLSHLAEDITGYGSSNIDSVASFLSNPEITGLLISGKDNGVDQDSTQMRGLGYLYMRTLYEGWGGTTTDAAGAITDGGALPKLDSFYTSDDNGLVSLVKAGGSLFDTFFTFIPRLAISNNAAVAPLLQSDSRFNFKPTGTDPATGQTTGISLLDPTRMDAHDASGVLGQGYQPTKCIAKDEAALGKCEIFATGGVTFLWEGAVKGDTVSLTAPSAYNIRFVAVKAKAAQ